MSDFPLCDITSVDNLVPLWKKSPDGYESLKTTKHCITNMNRSKRLKIQEELSDDEDFHMNSDLSEYEKMVEKNREEKMAFLEALKINEAREGFKLAVDIIVKAKPKNTHGTVRKHTKQEKNTGPTRRSLRLSKTNVDLSEDAVMARAIAEVAQAEVQTLPEKLPFEDALNENHQYSQFIVDFAELDFKKETPVRHEDHIRNMILEESNISKVVDSRITAMAVHPNPEKVLVCAGSKYGTLGFWNVNSDSDPYRFRPHLEGITCLHFHPYQPHQLLSTSYDGILRCANIENKMFSELYNASEETSCTYFDFLSQHTFLVAQKDGNVAIVDARSEKQKFGKKHRCHDYPIKTVSVHPVNKSYFFTASNRGNMSLWDLRKLQKQSLIEIENHHKRSISSAFFSPVTGNYILTTSSDDSICLFDSSNLSTNISLKKSMKHNNHTGRWLTQFRAAWLPNNDDAFVVGSMQNYPRRVEFYNSNMNIIYNLIHENLNSITSVNIFHPSLPVLACANSSGKVYLFTGT